MYLPQGDLPSMSDTGFSARLHSGSPLFCAVKSPVDGRIGVSQSQSQSVSAYDSAKGEHQQQASERLSDVHLASRKAEEIATRRFQATSWLQKMVGPLDLSCEPSEEELRLCLRNGLVLCNLVNKIQPGAVQKVVENPTPASPPEGPALSAYQYFENVRNFLVAVEEMKLPSFEASDLGKGSLAAESLAKVVDCILSLKSYCEWKQNGRQGVWKFGGATKSPCAPRTAAWSSAGSSSSSGNDKSWEALPFSTTKVNSRHRKCWVLPTFDNPKNLSEQFASPCTSSEKPGHGNNMQKLHHNFCSSKDDHLGLDPTTAWFHQLSQKFPDVLSLKNKKTQEEVAILQTPGLMNGVNNAPSQSLLSLVTAVLSGRQLEEIPLLVEFILKKLMEEFEHRLSRQGEQPNISEGETMNKNANIITIGNCQEQQTLIQSLQLELEQAKLRDQEHGFCLEVQKSEIEGLKNMLQGTKQDIINMQCKWDKELKALDLHIQGLAQAAAGYHQVVKENRELYNQVQDLKGNIRVYCRVRPFLPGQNGAQSTVDSIGENGSLMIVNPTKLGKEQRRTFNFNKVFGPSTSQEDVFLDTQPLIRSVLDGYNVCIFAYGQTGSGKTHTMTGPSNASQKDWGVNFRALHDLFEMSQSRKDLVKYEVGVQMIEIYNEQVRDLLCMDGGNKRLEIRNKTQQNGLNVPDASMVPVMSTPDVLEVMNTGHRNRSFGATAINERSSRSHSVLTVHVQGTDLVSATILHGCLHLIDLAGSERVDKSEAVGDRLKEAQHINKSLSALGDVISALAHKSLHVPYRNSKLTQLLQNSLGGQAKTLMFVHISPDEESYRETVSTLKFAERVATVELGVAQSNKEYGDIQELKEQISLLQDVLAKRDTEGKWLQKDIHSKGDDSGPDNVKSKSVLSPLHRVSVDVHLQGNHRQPLEEMRNAEVCQSHSYSSSANKYLPTSRFAVDSRTGFQTLSSSRYGLSSIHQEYLSKQRAIKAPRQASSPVRSLNSEISFGEIWCDVPKNKIKQDLPQEQEVVSIKPQARPLNCKRFVTQNTGQCAAETPKGIDIDGQMIKDDQGSCLLQLRENGPSKPEEEKSELKHMDDISVLSIQAIQSPHFGVPKRKYDAKKGRTSQFNRNLHEPDIKRDYSSEELVWRKSDGENKFADTEVHSSPPIEKFSRNKSKLLSSSGKLRHSIDRRCSNRIQQFGPLAASDCKVLNTGAHTRSRRYSLIGSTTVGMEALSSGRSGVKPTLEAKLAISSEGAVECYAKTTMLRQSYSTSSKASKRWI